MVIFNAGWSTVQTAHLAMIPELFPSDDARESLTLIRNSMTAFANILGYVAALLAFTYGILKMFITYCLRLPYNIRWSENSQLTTFRAFRIRKT